MRLHDKINLLNLQFDLLHKLSLVSQKEVQQPQKEGPTKTANSISERQGTSKTTSINISGKNTKANASERNDSNQKRLKCGTIQGEQVSAEVLKVQTHLKCQEVINLAPKESKDALLLSDNNLISKAAKEQLSEQWKEVSYNSRRRRRTIIENNSETSIKGVEKLVHLHVSQINNKTSSSELCNLLEKSFPEVICA